MPHLAVAQIYYLATFCYIGNSLKLSFHVNNWPRFDRYQNATGKMGELISRTLVKLDLLLIWSKLHEFAVGTYASINIFDATMNIGFSVSHDVILNNEFATDHFDK